MLGSQHDRETLSLRDCHSGPARPRLTRPTCLVRSGVRDFTKEIRVNRSTRWSVAFGAGILLSLGLLAPVATATACPTCAACAERHAPLRRPEHRFGSSRPLRARRWSSGPSTRATTNAAPLPSTPTIDAASSTRARHDDSDFLATHPDLLRHPHVRRPHLRPRPVTSFYALTSHAAQLKNTFRDVKKLLGHRLRRHPAARHARQPAARPRQASPGRCRCSTIFAPERGVCRLRRRDRRLHERRRRASTTTRSSRSTRSRSAREGEQTRPSTAIPDKLVFGDGILDAHRRDGPR